MRTTLLLAGLSSFAPFPQATTQEPVTPEADLRGDRPMPGLAPIGLHDAHGPEEPVASNEALRGGPCASPAPRRRAMAPDARAALADRRVDHPRR